MTNVKTENRSYRQGARARATERTRAGLIAAAVAAWRRGQIAEVSLASIAAEAGTTQQTLIRHFGSKDGLIHAALAQGASGIEALRDAVPAGDRRAALDMLIAHYETDGPVMRRTLRHVEQSEAAAAIVAHGRKVHRDWVARVFRVTGRARLDALVVATDLESWILLREGMGRSVAEARAVVEHMLTSLLGVPDE